MIGIYLFSIFFKNSFEKLFEKKCLDHVLLSMMKYFHIIVFQVKKKKKINIAKIKCIIAYM